MSIAAAIPVRDRAHDRTQVAWTAAAIGFGGVPHLAAVAPWITLLVLLLAAWRIAAAVRGWALPSLWVRLPVTLVGFAGVVFTYHSISGVEAGSALLLVMSGLKLLETRTERDRTVVVFIGYFLLFAVFLREQAIWSMAWLVIGTLGVTAALAQVVRYGPLLSPTGSVLLAGRLALQALPLAAVLFVLFPRIPGPFWTMPTAPGGAVSGLAEQVSPGDITELSLSDAVAFRVRFDGVVPPPGSLYWRGPVLERFDGRTWSAAPLAAAQPGRVGMPTKAPAVPYEVVLEPQAGRWLLALERPVQWSLPGATLTANGQLVDEEPISDRLAYRARSVLDEGVASLVDSETLAANLRLPAGRNPRTVEMARELRARGGDDRAFLATLLQLFREGDFAYSLTPPPLGAQPVDDFLFTARSGFCEHYASALATLARAGNLPARVVVGYQGGERNPLGDYWIVRQANAHAWVEVWLDGAWRRVDPTAAVAPERIERGVEEAFANAPLRTGRFWRTSDFAGQMVLAWDAANAAWDRWVLAFGPETQEALLRALGFEFPLPIQLAGLAAAASIACLALMAIALRQRNHQRPDPAARLYAQLCRRLAPVVRPRGKGETAREYAAAIGAARPDLALAVREMTDMYLELRYGPDPDPGLYRRLAAHVRRFRPARG